MIRIGQVIVSGVDIDQDTLNKLNNIPEVANGIDGEGIVTAPVVKAELEKYQTKSDMEGYAKTSDIPDVSDLVNKSELTNLATKDDISDFITRDDIPDVDLTTLDMYYNSNKKSFELTYKNEVLSQVDVSDFVKDGMLDSANIEGTNLVMTFNTDSGKQPITIDLSKLIKAYTAGNGIQIVNNTISITEDVATKDDIPSLDGYAKTSDIPDISGKADKSEIPSLDGYATEVYVDNSLDEINEALKKVVNGETPVGKEYTAGEGININDNVISADTTKLATKTDLEGLARWEDVPNPNLFASKSDLDTKADKSEIPDVSNFITRDDIPEVPDTSNFATRDEIPIVPENVSAFNNDAGYLTEHQDLSEYATKNEIPDVSNFVTSDQIPNTDEFVTRGELPNFNDFATTSQLADKADRSDIPDVSNFATISQLDDKADRSELPNVNEFATKSELEDKADKTEIPSLEGYATEEYVDNAVANAGGSGSGNYLKLVDDLDSYEGTEGEIVKYSGDSNDKYIQGADYIIKSQGESINIPSGTKYTTINDYVIYNQNINAKPLNIELYKYSEVINKHTRTNYVGVIEGTTNYCCSYTYDETDHSTINASINTYDIVTFNPKISITTSSDKKLSYYKTIPYTYSFPTNVNNAIVYQFLINVTYKNLCIGFIINDATQEVLSKFNVELYFSNATTSDVNINGNKVIELTDFCKRALNIEQ